MQMNKMEPHRAPSTEAQGKRHERTKDAADKYRQRNVERKQGQKEVKVMHYFRFKEVSRNQAFAADAGKRRRHIYTGSEQNGAKAE